MKSKRRHGSLIPLSREHHYALMLCLRIHRGLKRHTDWQWLDGKRRQAIQFFEADLVLHFAAEEEVLFPAMKQIAQAQPVIEELLSEHRHMERLIAELHHAKESSLPNTLNEFVDTLEAHIRKEERVLFPIYEQRMSGEVAAAVQQQIIERIGTALKPRHPELLK